METATMSRTPLSSKLCARYVQMFLRNHLQCERRKQTDETILLITADKNNQFIVDKPLTKCMHF